MNDSFDFNNAQHLLSFGKFLCGQLDIPPIKMKLVSNKKMVSLPGTQAGDQACYLFLKDSEGNVVEQSICILSKKTFTMRDYAILAHEVRHYWQRCIDPEFFFSEYADMTEEEYHRSKAEIDANAFACVAMALTFGVVSTRNYTDPVTQKLFDERLSQLNQKYQVDF